jgi:outer membrane immunogenic protein
MRRTVIGLLAGFFSLAFVQAASAQINWAGWYIGVNAGGIWGHSTATDVTGYNSAGSTISYNPNGFQGGLHGGFNWQITPWVWGVEGELGFLSWASSAQYGPYIGVRSAADSVAHTSNGAFAVLAGRVGFTFNNILLFAKAGGIFTTVKNSFTDTDPIGTTLVAGTDTANRNGWTVGAGLEYAWSVHWSSRVEYAHYDFGNVSHTALAAFGTPYTFRHSLTADSVRIGVTFR